MPGGSDATRPAESEADGDSGTEEVGTDESGFSGLVDFVVDGLFGAPAAVVAEEDVEVELLGAWPGWVALEVGAGPAELGERVGPAVGWLDGAGVGVGVGSAA